MPEVSWGAEQVESMARKLCSMLNTDPDQDVQVPHPVIQGTSTSVPLWQTYAQSCQEFALMRQALELTLGEEAQGGEVDGGV